jgi:hypothetical protein
MRAVLFLLALVAGFLAGGVIGSLTVPEGAGLSAGATVFVWALGGMTVLGALSLWLALRLGPGRLRNAVIALGVVIAALVLYLTGMSRATEAGSSVAPGEAGRAVAVLRLPALAATTGRASDGDG